MSSRDLPVGGSVSIFTVDSRGIVTFSRGGGLIPECSRTDEVTGESAFLLLEGLPQVQHDLRRALAGEDITRRIQIEGQEHAAWLAPVRDPQGRIAGAVAVCARAGNGANAGAVKVLVIDDNVEARNLMVLYLTRCESIPEGVDIRVAANGVEAFQILSSFVPELIVLDVFMPVMDGMTFLRSLRLDPRYEGISVVPVTSRHPTSAELDRLEKDASSVLRKGPGMESGLVAALERVRRRRPSAARA